MRGMRFREVLILPVMFGLLMICRTMAAEKIEVGSLAQVEHVDEVPAEQFLQMGAPDVISSDGGSISFFSFRRSLPRDGEWMAAGILMADRDDKSDSAAITVRLWTHAPAKLRLEHSRTISHGKQFTVAQFLVGDAKLQFTLTSDGTLYADTTLIGKVE